MFIAAILLVELGHLEEIFLNAPSGEIGLCDFYDILSGTALLIGGKHHGMFGNPVDKGRFDLTFALVP